MHPKNINMSYYNLQLQRWQTDIAITNQTEFNITINSVGLDTKEGELVRDITLINSIRQSSTPAVQDLFEQLLTTLAISE